jgi:hypothetical protein
VGRVAFKRRVIPLKGNHVFTLPSCIVSFHLLSPRMGGTRSSSALSLEERDFAEVGTFQPSFGFCPSLSFKDVHHQCWGGECAELGSVSARAATRSFPQRSRGRAFAVRDAGSCRVSGSPARAASPPLPVPPSATAAGRGFSADEIAGAAH